MDGPVLVVGAKGMLAAHLIPLLKPNKLELADVLGGESAGVKVSTLDITESNDVERLVSKIKPSWIVNCAAYTAVDAAELNQELAYDVNAIGPMNLAAAARGVGSRLLHVSTDYVFGGERYAGRDIPFSENERLAPCGVYGQSKRFGEEFVRAYLPDRSLVIRTSWLHGLNGPSFVATILRLSEEQGRIKVVNDQVGSPTWAGWLAQVMVKLMTIGHTGVIHATSRGNISWFDVAKEIAKLAKLDVEILPQTTKESMRAAKRPAFSTLNVTALEKLLGEPAIDWRAGIQKHLEALGRLK